MRRLKLLGFFVIICISCNPGVVFDDANPPSISSISTLPKQYQGAFLCESDSSIIRIYPKLIIQEALVEFVTTLDKIEETENCSIADGGLYLPGRKECFPFEYLADDTISAIIYELDTLFSIGHQNIAKVYKGQLFLNVKSHSGRWMTWVVRQEPDGRLMYSYIDIPEDQKAIEEITKNYKIENIERGKIQYVLKPTIKEFEEVLASEYSVFCDLLLPVNVEFDFPSRLH